MCNLLVADMNICNNVLHFLNILQKIKTTELLWILTGGFVCVLDIIASNKDITFNDKFLKKEEFFMVCRLYYF
jgi:hypothetical protein